MAPSAGNVGQGAKSAGVPRPLRQAKPVLHRPEQHRREYGLRQNTPLARDWKLAHLQEGEFIGLQLAFCEANSRLIFGAVLKKLLVRDGAAQKGVAYRGVALKPIGRDDSRRKAPCC
eukprot:6199220-Pleurochrysis_carterae.AAC.1